QIALDIGVGQSIRHGRSCLRIRALKDYMRQVRVAYGRNGELVVEHVQKASLLTFFCAHERRLQGFVTGRQQTLDKALQVEAGRLLWQEVPVPTQIELVDHSLRQGAVLQ